MVAWGMAARMRSWSQARLVCSQPRRVAWCISAWVGAGLRLAVETIALPTGEAATATTHVVGPRSKLRGPTSRAR